MMITLPGLNSLHASMPEEATPARQSSVQHEPIVWDLTLLYATEQDWQRYRQRFEQAPERIASFQGRLGESAQVLADALETAFGLTRDFIRFSTYASLLRAENARDPANVERGQLVSMIGSRMWTARSFMEPELLALGEDTLLSFLDAEPRLEIFRFYLTNLLRRQPHTLGAEAEQVLSLLGPISGAGQSVFSLLTNSDMRWPTVTLSDGTEAELTQPGFSRYRAVANREDRELVFRTYWGFLSQYEATIGNTYFHNVQAAVLNARARNHPTALSQRFFRENLPEKVYTQLLEQVHAGLPSFHRYLALRQRVLGVDQLYYHDIYNSLVEDVFEFDYDTARELTLRSAAPLGEEYSAKLAAGLAGPFTHVFPQPGKAPGAFMSGSVVDAHPYILLNFDGSFENVSTLAHEWGHALHSLYANAAQPFTTARYSLFIAEIAAFTNELLLSHYMLERASDPQERIFYLNHSVDRIRGAFFRQAKFAEFEYRAHKAVEQRQPLSGQRLSAMYGELLRQYFGHDEGILKVHPEYHIEWAIIPHFYNNFYVYNYSTSMAAAAYFAEGLLAGDSEVLENYLNVLRAGGSDFPVEILRKQAGLDMTGPAAYEALMRLFNRNLDQLESLLNEAGH